MYCINAARYLFGAEPMEVIGVRSTAAGTVPESTNRPPPSCGSTASGSRRSSPASTPPTSASYVIVGTKGQLRLDPAYEYAEALAYELTVDGKTTRSKDQARSVRGELVYFSDCVLRNRQPEPSGLEGLQDVRIVQALYESARRGEPVHVPAYEESKRPDKRQEMRRPAVRKPELVRVESAHEE